MTIQRFPGWRWGKDHPEGAIFEREEDVPKGYVDDPNLLDKPKQGAPAPHDDLAKRAEITAALKAKGIKYFAGAKTDKLAELLANA